MVTNQYEGCYFCDVTNPAAVEEHHIVPQRMNGSDEAENLVDLCGSCHNKIEDLYDERFYARLGVDPDDGVERPEYSDGHKLPPKATEDRLIPPESDHVRVERLWHGLKPGPKYYEGSYNPNLSGTTIPPNQVAESSSGVNQNGGVDYPDYYRLHCGYCHTVFSQYEHSDMARHLRVHHGVENPYESQDTTFADPPERDGLLGDNA